MIEEPDRPLYRLQPCCRNCRFYKRRISGGYAGFCKIGEYQFPEAKELPKKKRRIYWVKTVLDGVCDNHLFHGRGILMKAYRLVKIQPL